MMTTQGTFVSICLEQVERIRCRLLSEEDLLYLLQCGPTTAKLFLQRALV